MNLNSIQILFLKDLFLSRRQMFAYLLAGFIASVVAALPNPTLAFIGFIGMVTVAIASGMHLIGMLLLAESTDQTRIFVMSLPVSLLEYSIGKIAVVLTTFLVPWSAMFASSVVLTFLIPGSNHGSVAVLPAIFFFLLAAFTVQLVVAVASESVGLTITVMVACNIFFNVFLMKLFALPEITAVTKSDVVSWPPVLTMLQLIEMSVIFIAIIIALFAQTRRRDLI